mgnify:CR=1 FL=1
MKEKDKKFAFWKYDLFPYILGGEIKLIKDNGWVEIKGYDGFCFRQIKIVSLKEGLEIYNKLEELKNKRQDMLELFDEKLRLQFPYFFKHSDEK